MIYTWILAVPIQVLQTNSLSIFCDSAVPYLSSGIQQWQKKQNYISDIMNLWYSMKNEMHLQSTWYFDGVIEEPLQSNNRPHDCDPNRKTSSEKVS